MREMSPRNVRGLHSNPTHHRPGGLGGKNGFVGGAQGLAALCSLRTWCPASQPWLKGTTIQLRLLFQKVQAPNLGGVHVVLGLCVHRHQELRFGNLCLDFRGLWKCLYVQAKVCCRGGALMDNFARAVRIGNVGLVPPQSPQWGTA